MPSFYKKGEKWYFITDIGTDPKTGRRKQKRSGGYVKKQDAISAEAKLRIEVEEGNYIEDLDITFETFAKQWLAIYKESVKASTVRVREHEIGILNRYLAKIKIQEISKKRYQMLLLELKKEDYARNTISGVHGTAQMIFKKAQEFDLIRKDPTEFAKLVEEKKTIEQIEQGADIPKYLEKEELKQFLDMAQNQGKREDYPMFLALAYTGLRLGELCALKWSDIDFKEKQISITKTLYNPNNNTRKYTLQTPKTKKSIRKIEVSQKVIDELKKVKVSQNNDHIATGAVWHNGNFVFTSERFPGYPTYLKHCENRMARLIRLLGFSEELTPHSLRHTHTSLLAEAGVGLEEIMERLGHTDDETTRKVYLHITKEMKKEAAHKFEKLMNDL